MFTFNVLFIQYNFITDIFLFTIRASQAGFTHASQKQLNQLCDKLINH